MLLSSLLNNTAVVASLMGVVKTNRQYPASKLLIPLSYAAIMGGMITLVGTSTNLIVNSFTLKAGLPGIGFFDFAYAGIPIALVGMVYLIFVVPRLLPNTGSIDRQEEESYFLEAEVTPGSRLIGRSVEENGFRHLEHLFLAELIRGDHLISPVTPETVLEAEDTLVFTGDVSQIQELRRFDGLSLLEHSDDLLRTNLQEVVIKHNSPLLGMRIKDAQFRSRFDAAVVAVRRGVRRLPGKLGLISMQPGDNLVLAVGQEFEKHENLRKHFIFISPVITNHALNHREGQIAAGLFLFAILTAALEWLTLFKAMVLLLAIYLLAGFLKLREMKNNLNLSLFFMIGSALGISHVLATYGIADDISEFIIRTFGGDSPYGALLGVYLTTVVITELITNNAAAALIFPIALSTARQLGVDPMPFIMAIAYAASASFISPIGYQTNTMVYSLGKYRFTDYTFSGLGLSLIYGILALCLIPWFFPF
jgi:di/tricarboxylate transporter